MTIANSENIIVLGNPSICSRCGKAAVTGPTGVNTMCKPCESTC